MLFNSFCISTCISDNLRRILSLSDKMAQLASITDKLCSLYELGARIRIDPLVGNSDELLPALVIYPATAPRTS